MAALAFVALGLVLILWPDASMHVLCYLVGGALTLYGGFNVLSFVFSQERAFTFELVIGVLTAAIGIFALLSPDSIRDILSVVLGLVVIIDSLIGIKRAFTLRELELSGWWVRLTLSVAAAILGVLFMLQKELFGRALLIVVGCVLLYQGLSDLFTVVQISVLGKRPQKAPGGRYGSGQHHRRQINPPDRLPQAVLFFCPSAPGRQGASRRPPSAALPRHTLVGAHTARPAVQCSGFSRFPANSSWPALQQCKESP